ncbi:MAG TPA: Flp pilus assembly protein CpaB [Chloroflexota bacterium]|nr:Flp pilus assembly protein CpaB [Chloroflexota bacterium]
MRKTRGILFIFIGIILAFAAAFMVMNISKQAATQAVAAPTPIPKSYIVVAQRDIPENVAVSSDDLAQQELPTALAPPGAIAAPEIAVGKYTTAPIYKGEIIVAPLLADNQRVNVLAAQIPDGKVAMAVTVNDTLNSLGVLRPGDHVDVILTLDVSPIVPKTPVPGNLANNPQNNQQSPPQYTTQLTLQNVQILAIGAPAGEYTPATPTSGQQSNNSPPVAVRAGGPTPEPTARPTPAIVQPRTLTFLLNHQDAVTLKFIKDSGGTMDLVLRSPTDNKVAETNAETLDSVYREFHFKFTQPVNQ